MDHREWTTLTNTTPHRPKHSTINFLGEHIKVAPLNSILSGEIEGSSLDDRRLLEFLFPDSLLGFSVDEATKYLDQLGAFSRITTAAQGNTNEFFFHNEVRRNVGSEASMANHLNHIAKALQHHYPNLIPRREWSSRNSSTPIPAIHPRKPDLTLCDPNMELLSWNTVHSIAEIKNHKSTKVPTAIVDTLRNKALLIFSAQPGRRYLITAWITSIAFGLIYFDRSGEIRASWQSGSHAAFVRLLAGLTFSPENILGYDPSVGRNRLGELTDVRVKGKTYRVLGCIFKAVVLRGRGTVCWLVERDDQQFVIKDTWADVNRQWQEWEFLQACKEYNIQNVAYLVDMEDIATDSTHLCRVNIAGAAEVEQRVHRRLVLRPICQTIDRFVSRAELLHALIDQIRAHEKLVEAGILHRDISPNNLALSCQEPHLHHEKCSSAKRTGSIIDFDYAIWIRTKEDEAKESIERKVSDKFKTGTRPFMSMEILDNDSVVDHAYQHDLESFFYVFLWICTFYIAPGTLRASPDTKTIPMYQWSREETSKEFQMHRFNLKILPFFTEYFADFKDLARELYDVMFPNGNLYASQSSVTHKSFIRIFEAKLTKLAVESSPMSAATLVQPSETMQAPHHVELTKRMLACVSAHMGDEGPHSDPSAHKRTRLH